MTHDFILIGTAWGRGLYSQYFFAVRNGVKIYRYFSDGELIEENVSYFPHRDMFRDIEKEIEIFNLKID